MVRKGKGWRNSEEKGLRIDLTGLIQNLSARLLFFKRKALLFPFKNIAIFRAIRASQKICSI